MSWAETFKQLSQKLQAAMLRLQFVADGKIRRWVYVVFFFVMAMCLITLGAFFPVIADNLKTMGLDKIFKLIGAIKP